MTYPFAKGHGTENDFVVLPDHDGTIHGDLPAGRVAALCHRRAGIGGDGVLRVVRTACIDPDQADRAEWFMDYRNSDGSLSEMCGNGIRVFARHLVDAGLVDPDTPIPIATRDGIKTLVVGPGGQFTVDLGKPRLLEPSEVTVGDRRWQATGVDMGNPHAVVYVDDLAEAGDLLTSPGYDHAVYPSGVNVEFVTPLAPGEVAMRVFERGAGETRSCGTGAAAVAVATAVREDSRPGPEGSRCLVRVPGGELLLTWTAEDRVLLNGPAVITATGETGL